MFYWINTLTLVTLAHLSNSLLKHKLIYRNVYLLLSPPVSYWVCSLLAPNFLSHQPQNNSWRVSMHFPKEQMANLFFAYSFFSQYSSIEESQSQSPLFPSSHPPYPGHHNSCLFSLPNLDQAASRSTLLMQALSQGTITSYLNLDKKPLLEVHPPTHTPPFKMVFPAYRRSAPSHSLHK